MPFMGTQNVANCPGLKQITRMGYVVTAPMDFTIITNGDGVSYSGKHQQHSQGIVTTSGITLLIRLYHWLIILGIVWHILSN